MTDHVYELPTDRCACGHTRMVHEPHCVVTYYAPKRACPDNCREFVHDRPETGGTVTNMSADLKCSCEVPDGHTRIDGTLYRADNIEVWEHGILNADLVPVEVPDD